MEIGHVKLTELTFAYIFVCTVKFPVSTVVEVFVEAFLWTTPCALPCASSWALSRESSWVTFCGSRALCFLKFAEEQFMQLQFQHKGLYPYPLGAGSASPYPKMGAPDPENPLFLGFSVLRGVPWSQSGPDHGVGVDPETVTIVAWQHKWLSKKWVMYSHWCFCTIGNKGTRARNSSPNAFLWDAVFLLAVGSFLLT